MCYPMTHVCHGAGNLEHQPLCNPEQIIDDNLLEARMIYAPGQIASCNYFAKQLVKLVRQGQTMHGQFTEQADPFELCPGTAQA